MSKFKQNYSFGHSDNRNRGNFSQNRFQNFSANHPNNDPIKHAFFTGKKFDAEAGSNSHARASNLLHLKKHLFSDNAALLASKAQISIERLNQFLANDINFPVNAEIAMHIENSLGLSPGWLDVIRNEWKDDDTKDVLEQMKGVLVEDQLSSPSELRQHAQEQPEHPTTTLQQAGTEVSSPDSPSPLELAFVQHGQQAQGTVVAMPSDTANTNKKASFPHAEAFEWLHSLLQRMPRGTASKIARTMNRSPNDFSAWLNGLRGAPHFCMQPMMRALDGILPDFADEARSRFGIPRDGSALPANRVTPATAQATLLSPTTELASQALLHRSDAPATEPVNPNSPATPQTPVNQGSQAKAPQVDALSNFSFAGESSPTELNAKLIQLEILRASMQVAKDAAQAAKDAASAANEAIALLKSDFRS